MLFMLFHSFYVFKFLILLIEIWKGVKCFGALVAKFFDKYFGFLKDLIYHRKRDFKEKVIRVETKI